MVTYITGQPITSVFAQSAYPDSFSEHDYLRIFARLNDNTSVLFESLWTTLPTSPGSNEASFEVRTPSSIFTLNDTDMNVNTFSSSDLSVSQPDTYEHFLVNGIHNGMFANSLNSFLHNIYLGKPVENTHQLNNAVYIASVCDAIHNSRSSNSIITLSAIYNATWAIHFSSNRARICKLSLISKLLVARQYRKVFLKPVYIKPFGFFLNIRSFMINACLITFCLVRHVTHINLYMGTTLGSCIEKSLTKISFNTSFTIF